MAYDSNIYPITQVISGGVTYNVPADVPCPTGFTWKLSDVSASDAGRTEDALMHKKRITQKRHLELEWANVYRADAAKIIKAFNSEYFQVKFWDLLSSDASTGNPGYLTLTFYSGDRESPMYNMALGIQSSVKFNIIEQ